MLDAAIALAAATAATLGFHSLGARLPPELANPLASNVWFDADVPYRLEAMSAGGGWPTGGAHPLFPGVGRLLLVLSARAPLAGEHLWAHARVASALTGGLWIALTYLLFRLLRLTRVDALLFSAIGFSSAGALFWFTVPESFGLSAVGTTLALLVAAASAPPLLAQAAACAASGGFVLSSGIVGAMSVLGHHRSPREWPRAALVGLAALGLLSAAWALQEWSRTTPFFLGDRLLEYEQHLYPVSAQRTLEIVPALLAGSIVAPALRNDTPSFRKQALRPAGTAGAVATATWGLLLLAGALTLAAAALRGDLRPFAITAFGGTVALAALHASLGREMFLYALNFVPLLLATAALSARRERRRALVRACAVVLLLSAGFTNVTQLWRAADAACAIAARRVGAPQAP